MIEPAFRFRKLHVCVCVYLYIFIYIYIYIYIYLCKNRTLNFPQVIVITVGVVRI